MSSETLGSESLSSREGLQSENQPEGNDLCGSRNPAMEQLLADVSSIKATVERIEQHQLATNVPENERPGYAQLQADATRTEHSRGIFERWNPFGERSRVHHQENTGAREQLLDLNAKLASKKTELSSVKKDLEQVRRELEREKSTLMQLRLQKASRDPSAKNHANLAEEYDKLFTSEARKVISYFGDHKIMEGAEAKQLLSKIFEEIYKACQTTVLQKIFSEIFQRRAEKPESASASADATTTKWKVDVYRELLLSSDIAKQTPEASSILPMISQPIEQLRDKEIMSDELHGFISNATQLAWSMITIQPPMVIDTPSEFSEDIHERQKRQWKAELDSYVLVYMRPVLYESHDGEVAKIGWVGNEEDHGDEDHGPTHC